MAGGKLLEVLPGRPAAPGLARLAIGLAGAGLAALMVPAVAMTPSFDCGRVATGSIAALVCDEAALAALDRKLAEVYRKAAAKAGREHPPTLKAEQRGWIKGRDECWAAATPRTCVAEAYRQRIAELQARYRLVGGRGPFSFACDGEPANTVMAMFRDTDPPTLIAERGDQVALMVRVPSGSGARYVGRNTSFWTQREEALVTWGDGAREMRCLRQP